MDYFKRSIAELHALLTEKKVSCVELTTYFLTRAKKLNSTLNSFVLFCDEEALKEAAIVDSMIQNGATIHILAGIPVAVKDIFLTRDVRTTCCSKMLENYIAPYNATVVQKLREVHAIIIGKTNMDEFAMGSSNENSYFGPVKNPWDTERVSGGSSGGSAVAVSAGQVVAALGTDTGGSIRQPASLTGTTGIKPTYGRVSRFGVIAFASSLDQVGVFARSAEDVSKVLETISGFDEHDSTSINETRAPNYKHSSKKCEGLRIGIPKQYFISGLQSEVEDSIQAAIKIYESLGAKTISVDLPHTKYAIAVYYIIATSEASSNLARYDGVKYGYRAKDADNLIDMYSKTRGTGFGSEVKRRIMLGTYALSSGYYDAYYKKAAQVRRLIKKDFDDAFKICDVILTPTSPTTAFKVGEKADNPLQMYLSDIFTISVNLATLPGISIPCGFDQNQLPIGFQLIGKSFDEAELLTIASAYQSKTDWHLKFPKLGDLV